VNVEQASKWVMRKPTCHGWPALREEPSRALSGGGWARSTEEPGYRFYLLHDKVWRADVLQCAYRRCKANKGAAGVGGQRFGGIEEYGAERWLGGLAQRLRSRTYEPQAVKRVWIPKPN
jgi:hypothetical protein